MLTRVLALLRTRSERYPMCSQVIGDGTAPEYGTSVSCSMSPPDMQSYDPALHPGAAPSPRPCPKPPYLLPCPALPCPALLP